MQIFPQLILLLRLVVLCGLACAAFAEDKKPANDRKLAAVLIWGTDEEKPNDPNLKEVEEKLKGKLKKIFKWQHYFVVKHQPFSVKPGESKSLTLSDKCEVKVKESEAEGLEVELFGEGKSVVKRKQSMPLNDVLILAGDDKNACAWFVVVKPASE
jgi:hypothetical protein